MHYGWMISSWRSESERLMIGSPPSSFHTHTLSLFSLPLLFILLSSSVRHCFCATSTKVKQFWSKRIHSLESIWGHAGTFSTSSPVNSGGSVAPSLQFRILDTVFSWTGEIFFYFSPSKLPESGTRFSLLVQNTRHFNFRQRMHRAADLYVLILELVTKRY